MLINLSNHPFKNWNKKQKSIALDQFSAVADIPFSEIDPMADTEEVALLASEYLSQCKAKLAESKDGNNAVHISGEPSFLFQFVTLAKAQRICCICSTTLRMVKNDGNIKTSIFQYVQFRKY